MLVIQEEGQLRTARPQWRFLKISLYIILYFFIKSLLIGVKDANVAKHVKSQHSVVGRLKANVRAWEDMEASDFILETIRTGYRIPFLETPQPAIFRNNRSALRHGVFVETAIDELLEHGGVIELESPPTVVNPLTVSESGEKKRLILDLRYVNAHVWSDHVKFEDFMTFQNFIHPGSFMFQFDFKNSYHHIDVFEEHWVYLGFSWTRNAVKKYYCFVVLPFGLCTTGYIFTKTCRVLVKYWRRNGIKIVLFMDDGIGAAGSAEKSKRAADFVKSSIEKSGFVTNTGKSHWVPSHHVTWLGLEINTDIFSIKIKKTRVEKVLHKISEMRRMWVCSARQISSIAGGIMSQDIVLGPVT